MLDRLFSKRKTSSARFPSTTESPTTSPSASEEMHFPQASFIRPRASRMVPRDDSTVVSVSRPSTGLSPEESDSGNGPVPDKTSPSHKDTLSPSSIPVSRASSSASSTDSSATFSDASDLFSRFPLAVGSTSFLSSASSASLALSQHCHKNGSFSEPLSPVRPSLRIPQRASSLSLRERRHVSVATLRGLPQSQSLSQTETQIQPLAQRSARLSTAFTTSSGEISPRTFLMQEEPLSQEKLPHLQPQAMPPQLSLRFSNTPILELQPLFQESTFDTPPLSGKAEMPLAEKAPAADAATDATTDVKATTCVVSQPTPEVSPKPTAKATAKPQYRVMPRISSATLLDTPLLQRDSVVSVVLAQDFSAANKTETVSDYTEAASPATPVDAGTVSEVTRPLSLSVTRRQSRIPRRVGSLPTKNERRMTVKSGHAVHLSTDSVLKEPNLGDFLSLSDEDIAETTPATPLIPSALSPGETDKQQAGSVFRYRKFSEASLASETSIASMVSTLSTASQSSSQGSSKRDSQRSSRNSQDSSPHVSLSPRRLQLRGKETAPPGYLPPSVPSSCTSTSFSPSLSPSFSTGTSRPQSSESQVRMAAAFEIARIASQYKFDLAYIATIWPKNMALQSDKQPSVTPSSTAAVTKSSLLARRRMTRANSQASVQSGSSRYSHVTLAGSITSSSSSTTATAGGCARVNSHTGLEAQFLAAYGLATVQAPYSLSAPTHAKILNAERWLEFREPDAMAHEFYMGYGCAFYRGHAPTMAAKAAMAGPADPADTGKASKQKRLDRYGRRPSMEDGDADTEQDDADEDAESSGRRTPRPAYGGSGSSETNNRGIVFVAYRRKSSSSDMEQSLSSDDLAALHRDVESLVDRILDCHMQQQRLGQLETLRTVPGLVDDVMTTSTTLPVSAPLSGSLSAEVSPKTKITGLSHLPSLGLEATV